VSPDLSAAWRRLDEHQPARPDICTPGALTDTERDVLDFEARPWPHGGAKLTAIRNTFGWSETRYYQVLRSLLDRPAALEHSPALIYRLRARLGRSTR